jgi:hypothetical protein
MTCSLQTWHFTNGCSVDRVYLKASLIFSIKWRVSIKLDFVGDDGLARKITIVFAAWSHSLQVRSWSQDPQYRKGFPILIREPFDGVQWRPKRGAARI